MSGICMTAVLIFLFVQITRAEIAATGAGADQFLAFKNLRAKLAALEDYQAVYIRGNHSREILRPFPSYHRQSFSEPLTVRMLPNLKRQKSQLWLKHLKRNRKPARRIARKLRVKHWTLAKSNCRRCGARARIVAR